ncbi:MAG: class I SAM-dependent methyltransferase [Deltaproteobacteria bacterium]|jgi:SAM-dependent methyltransferase|nr:class I SAM-dependent methyltransferase [Deltaproteobacteria bacterium]
MSTPRIYETVVDMAKAIRQGTGNGDLAHLDIGAGTGDLIVELSRHVGLRSEACDFHVERFPLSGKVPIRRTNINQEPLPYPDQSFDLVTSTEVIEHLENPRLFLREIARVLRPGGHAILSTPNVLNLKSRVRYLGSGFFNLFGPLPLPGGMDEKFSANSHISPVSYFYLAHGLHCAGFRSLDMATDKAQKTSVLWLALLWPLILALWPFFWLKESRLKGTNAWTRDERVRAIVKGHMSWRLLTGRTLIVCARK